MINVRNVILATFCVAVSAPELFAQRQPAVEPESDMAVVDRLVSEASKEAEADTAFPATVAMAVERVGLHARRNAFATIPVAVGSVQGSDDTVRKERRLRELRSGLRPIVLAGLKDPDGSVRRYAFAALAVLGRGEPKEESAVRALADRLFASDPQPEVRAIALGVLLEGTRTKGGNWTLIERALKDPSPAVKTAGYAEVGLARPPEAVSFILQGLNDETEPWLRLSAAAALVAYAPTHPEVVEALSARIEMESEPYIKEQLGHVLKRMKEIARPK